MCSWYGSSLQPNQPIWSIVFAFHRSHWTKSEFKWIFVKVCGRSILSRLRDARCEEFDCNFLFSHTLSSLRVFSSFSFKLNSVLLYYLYLCFFPRRRARERRTRKDVEKKNTNRTIFVNALDTIFEWNWNTINARAHHPQWFNQLNYKLVRKYPESRRACASLSYLLMWIRTHWFIVVILQIIASKRVRMCLMTEKTFIQYANWSIFPRSHSDKRQKDRKTEPVQTMTKNPINFMWFDSNELESSSKLRRVW